MGKIKKNILITGCSSGIGRDAAITLHSKGWRVLATCRSKSDCKYFEKFGINQINNPEWVGFFIITALFCLPAIILIYYIDNKRKIN